MLAYVAEWLSLSPGEAKLLDEEQNEAQPQHSKKWSLFTSILATPCRVSRVSVSDDSTCALRPENGLVCLRAISNSIYIEDSMETHLFSICGLAVVGDGRFAAA